MPSGLQDAFSKIFSDPELLAAMQVMVLSVKSTI